MVASIRLTYFKTTPLALLGLYENVFLVEWLVASLQILSIKSLFGDFPDSSMITFYKIRHI